MKVFKPIGSKERLFEMFQKVNKIKINEDFWDDEEREVVDRELERFKDELKPKNKPEPQEDDSELSPEDSILFDTAYQNVLKTNSAPTMPEIEREFEKLKRIKDNKPLVTKKRQIPKFAEKFFEGVDELNVDLDSIVSIGFDKLLNNRFKTEFGGSNVSKIQTTGNVTSVEITGKDNTGNEYLFNFKLVGEQDEDTFIIDEIEMTQYKFISTDKNEVVEFDVEDLNEYNKERKQEYYDAIINYVDIGMDGSVEINEDDVKHKEDSYPFGGGAHDLQVGKNFANNEPTNPKLRVTADELNKYIDEIYGEINDNPTYEKFPSDTETITPFRWFFNQSVEKRNEILKNAIRQLMFNKQVLSDNNIRNKVEDIINNEYYSDTFQLNEKESKNEDVAQLPIEKRKLILKAYYNLTKKIGKEKYPINHDELKKEIERIKNEENFLDFDETLLNEKNNDINLHDINLINIRDSLKNLLKLRDEIRYKPEIKKAIDSLKEAMKTIYGISDNEINKSFHKRKTPLKLENDDIENNIETDIENNIEIDIENIVQDKEEIGDLIHGGLADNKSPSEFDKEQLLKGIGVELEHTNDPMIAVEIAMDHLVEDPEYYTVKDDPEASAQANASMEAEEDLPHVSGAYIQDGMAGELDRNGNPIPAIEPNWSKMGMDFSNSDKDMTDELLGYKPHNVGDEVKYKNITEFDSRELDIEKNDPEAWKKIQAIKKTKEPVMPDLGVTMERTPKDGEILKKYSID